MKKLLFLCALLGSTYYAVGQDGGMVSKKGVNIMPESGEYGLGFNAVPIFNYLGNSFNGNGGNSINNTSYFVNSDNMLYGKYFTANNQAYRVRVRIRDVNTNTRNDVVAQGQFDPDSVVTDRLRRSDRLVGLSAGMEKRRGKGRVQGVYGVEAMYTYGQVTDKYAYGNSMGGQFIAPETTTNFNAGTTSNVSSRVTSTNFGASHSIGVMGFAGVEYFFAAKMSISAEFTWGGAFTSTGKFSQTTEEYTNGEPQSITNTNVGSNQVAFDTGNRAGAIALLFYF